MSDIFDHSFKEQINLFYFAHMPRVAHDLFAQGLKTSTVASNLLITKEKAQRLHELYEKGELTETSVESKFSDFHLPFAKISDQYNWEDFAYEVKCAAKLFFDMWLSVRAIASYLRVPENTVYAWRKLYKNNNFIINIPVEKKLENLKLTTEKFTIINSRKYYSYEIRKIAKECFEKGMKFGDVAKYLEIPRETVYGWNLEFKVGRFYVNEEEKHSLSNPLKETPNKYSLSLLDTEKKASRPKGKRLIYTEEVRRAAIACFEEGLGYRATADSLGLPQSTVRDWNRLYKEGQFKIKN